MSDKTVDDLLSLAKDLRKALKGIYDSPCYFALKGPKGESIWTVTMGESWPGVEAEKDSERPGKEIKTLSQWQHLLFSAPSGGPISYHTPHRQFDGQSPRDLQCTEYGECYTNGSFTAGGDLVAPFLREGDSAVWAALKQYYDNIVEPKSQAVYPEAQ